MSAPFGRRLCEVAENRASGGYRVGSAMGGRSCRFGACFGCAVLKPEGGYIRLCGRYPPSICSTSS